MQFQFATAGQIAFGVGVRRVVAEEARRWGTRILLVTGGDRSRFDWLVEDVERQGAVALVLPQTGEPTVTGVAAQLATVRRWAPDVVIGAGGGAALDAAKALAALVPNEGQPLDYLEVIGQGRALRAAPLPWIAVPTTAGTGSEVTRNAVLGSPQHGVKASLRSPLLLARAAFVDPALTLTVSRGQTAASGLDALTQLIEPYVSVKANALTDSLCREAIPRASRALRRVFRDPSDLNARTEMAFASLMSGLALANSGLGAVHGLAAVLGGRFDAPHGAVCARLLAPVVEANLQVAGPHIERYLDIAEWMTWRRDAVALVAELTSLTGELEIPRLSHWGVTDSDLPALARQSLSTTSMKGNPAALSESRLTEALAQSL
jgi:alcohol dehydrogenase class IV